MTSPDEALIAELQQAAVRESDFLRGMAEAKSLRQESNHGRRTDLYMWPTPERTLPGRAAKRLQELSTLPEGYVMVPRVPTEGMAPAHEQTAAPVK